MEPAWVLALLSPFFQTCKKQFANAASCSSEQLLGLSQRDFVYPGTYLWPGACCFLPTALVPHHEMSVICFLSFWKWSDLHTSAFCRPLCMQRREQQSLPCLCQLQPEDLHLLGCAAGENGVHQPVENPGWWPRVWKSPGAAGYRWVQKAMYRVEDVQKERKGCWQMISWELEYFLMRLSHCLMRMPNSWFSLFSVDRSDVSAVKNLIHKTLYYPEKYHLSSPSEDSAGTDSSAHCSGIQDPL